MSIHSISIISGIIAPEGLMWYLLYTASQVLLDCQIMEILQRSCTGIKKQKYNLVRKL